MKNTDETAMIIRRVWQAVTVILILFLLFMIILLWYSFQNVTYDPNLFLPDAGYRFGPM